MQLAKAGQGRRRPRVRPRGHSMSDTTMMPGRYSRRAHVFARIHDSPGLVEALIREEGIL